MHEPACRHTGPAGEDSGAVRRPLSGLRTLDLATELAAPFTCTRRAGFARVFEAMRGLTT
ncbi:hypothetical protein AWV80_39775 [Cupriavidus sp. UYMU48A]|nr:hypothetical protein AWV80_29105 [Cupriavidus sp. UYMU48A]KAF7964313.1 hypothetical protein AWV80_39775 [Cupriavidus sp. UYMU48A]